MNQMLKRSEVCEMLGVTRRTLQEYDKIGLLSPTVIAENGYWYYDNEAVNTLVTIQTFVELGYKRKEIKSILCSDKNRMIAELDCAARKLEDEKSKIEGEIKYVQYMQTIYSLPDFIIKPLLNLDLTKLLKNETSQSYNNLLEKVISRFSDPSDEEMQDIDLMASFIFALYAIGGYKNYSYRSKTVQKCVGQACMELMRYGLVKAVSDEDIDIDLDQISNEDLLADDEFVEIATESILEMLSDDEFADYLDSILGSGATEYSVKAVNFYMNTTMNNSHSNEETSE